MAAPIVTPARQLQRWRDSKKWEETNPWKQKKKWEQTKKWQGNADEGETAKWVALKKWETSRCVCAAYRRTHAWFYGAWGGRLTDHWEFLESSSETYMCTRAQLGRAL